jgi:hypothetical protein
MTRHGFLAFHYHTRLLWGLLDAARASSAVGSDSHEADSVPRLAEEAQNEQTSGGETAEKLSLEEDSRTSIKGGLSRAGISPRHGPRATMQQGVDQPCGIRGSWGCGPALLSPSTAAPPMSPLQQRWHRVSTTLRRQPAAGTGAGVGALAVGVGAQAEAGREGKSRRWPARQAGKARFRRG